jgi:putative nucleotidyltransferase with HDIG domain
LIKHVSWERIRDELIKTVASPFPADGIMLLFSAGLLEYILPELTAGVNVPQGGHHIYDVFTHSIESLRHCPSSDSILRLATLLHDIGKPKTFVLREGKPTFYSHEVAGARIAKQIADRLRLSSDQRNFLWKMVRWHMFAYESHMTDSAIRRFMRRVGKEDVPNMMMLRVGDRLGGGSKETSWRLEELKHRIEELMHDPLTVADLKIDGHDVMKILNSKPGPTIGKVLNALFEEILEDPKKNERSYLLSRIPLIAGTDADDHQEPS